MKKAEELEEMRNRVRKSYHGESWVNKVDAMEDKEVRATYKRLVRCGKIRGTR